MYYVLCNERYRINLRAEQTSKVSSRLFTYIYIWANNTPLLCISRYARNERFIEGQVDSAFVP